MAGLLAHLILTAGALSLVFALSAVSAPPAYADPVYEGPLLYGLDPVLRATEDPRLLGVERLALARRLKGVGIDPYRYPERRPSLESSIRHFWETRSNVDLRRMERLVEYNGPLGLMTEIEYPSFFFLFPTPETLPGGFVYYPPRPVGDPVVKLFVDDVASGAARRHAVDQAALRTEALDISGGGRRTDQTGGLINLTIPIKLPRTLEKIIGRGEKTKIKITGRERIAISGESRVINPFTPTERVSSQSLFPTLDMEQELQINLSGTIGEKIIIEVDHNSAAIGPDGTKIKLMYRGTEDEIIKTIETGDVGLTLPGSQLLGYNSNKSGLFGIKVTGQLGRADFTVVASKQKAETSSKTFNAQGGQVSDNIILSSQYLNNRFFRLDLPALEPGGRRGTERIDYNSVKIFRLMPAGTLGNLDIGYAAVYADSNGFSQWPNQDFSAPFDYGSRWREIPDFDPLLDSSGGLVAVDMRNSMADDDILAVVYNIIQGPTSAPVLVAKVGDNPVTDAPTQTLPGEGTTTFYRMKLLKAPTNRVQKHVFGYVMRNIYPLGGANIDETTFQLKIERIQAGLSNLEIDENGLDYIRIFGLDQTDAQGGGRPDGIVDWDDPYLFDLQKGLLKFPLDFPTPFNGTEQQYRDYADTTAFVWDGTFLKDNVKSELYDPDILPTEYSRYASFRIVSTHAAAASSFNLGASNIEEGSEVVTLNGRTLSNGTDYDIDYTFGEINLLGDAANELTPDSKIAVTYQYAPFFGGGNTSLTGFNLGYDLGRDSKMSTTWLYQSESIVGEKAKLGEEPSKNLVGNLNLQHTFRPYFLTHVANFVSRRNTERESTLQFSGETAVSLPNPNTKGKVFLEDFEGVDSSDIITLSRIGWFWGSAPFLSPEEIIANNDTRQFDPEDRVETVRWYLPKDRVLRRYLNPDLVNQERDETQQAMEMYLRADDGSWDSEDWGGIMRGISRTGLDLSKSQFVEIWVNDGVPDIDQRRGKLHIDFGYISEDGFWPVDSEGNLTVGQQEKEDGILSGTPDGVWTFDEDVGLDGNEFGPQRFSADEVIEGDSPFPQINGTARNNREDDEDLNSNGRLDRDSGYFTTTIDLKDSEALVDVVYDYDDVQDLVAGNISWRKYRIPIGAVNEVSNGTAASIKAVTHVRIWYEDDAPGTRSTSFRLQLSEFKFLGSRWEREGVRRIDGEKLLTKSELLPGEQFFLGEVNNKENPDYFPPFAVEEVNNIPTKEQSLVLNFQNIEQGHMVRASKQVSPRGDDYTGYRDISWWWFNPSFTTADLDLYFRVGSDSLNYYEVDYSYANKPSKVDWHQVVLGIAELSNAKNGVIDENGHVKSKIRDRRTGEEYDVTVVGRPDLRLVKRYYFGIRNQSLSQPATGYIYLNDVLLEGVKRDMGLAQRAGLRLNMADVIKVDFDWNRTDAEFHGLNSRTGSGINAQDWNLSASLNLDDFIPLLGFRLPMSGGRRQSLKRPKYETNSDIEIIDDGVRDALSTIETQERFSSRLSHSPSKAAIPRYLVDPWSIQVSGSRGELSGPTEARQNKSLQGSVNYDLRIPGLYRLGRYPLFKYIPVVRSVSIVPKKFAFGANFNSTKNSSVAISEAGVVTQRPTQLSRPGQLTGSVDYQPLTIIDLSFGANSTRDLLREQLWNGINIGEENGRSYSLRMTFLVPRAREMPQTKFLAPVRALARGLTKMRPSIQFNGAFGDVHDPGVRQQGDPADIRSLSNTGRWEFRLDVPVGDAFKSVFPERKYSSDQQQRMIAEQRRREQQEQRTSGPQTLPPDQDGANPDQPDTPGADDRPEDALTPEEIQRREEERLLEEAQAQLEEDRELGLVAPAEEASLDEGGKLNPLRILDPVFNTLRNTTPVKVTYTDNRSSAYARIQQKASFWYKTGLVNELDTADSLYATSAFDTRQSFSLSTTSKVTKNISLDVKFGKDTSFREQVGSQTRSYKQNWPEAQFSLAGIERWRVFGGNKEDREAGWFQSSNFNISYKKTKTVNNITANSYNPNINTSMTPRWTMTFRNGLNATINATLSNDESLANGIRTVNSRTRFGLNFRHQFNAQTFLAKLGLYRPGSSQSLNMDVDISYDKDRTQRENKGLQVTAPTGQNRYNVNPRFTYQITRNLSGSVRFIFSRTKNVATNQTTTTFGLGLEATFVF